RPSAYDWRTAVKGLWAGGFEALPQEGAQLARRGGVVDRDLDLLLRHVANEHVPLRGFVRHANQLHRQRVLGDDVARHASDAKRIHASILAQENHMEITRRTTADTTEESASNRPP